VGSLEIDIGRCGEIRAVGFVWRLMQSYMERAGQRG